MNSKSPEKYFSRMTSGKISSCLKCFGITGWLGQFCAGQTKRTGWLYYLCRNRKIFSGGRYELRVCFNLIFVWQEGTEYCLPVPDLRNKVTKSCFRAFTESVNKVSGWKMLPLVHSKFSRNADSPFIFGQGPKLALLWISLPSLPLAITI